MVQAGVNEEVTFKQKLKRGEGVNPVVSWGMAVEEERTASAKTLSQIHTWHIQRITRRSGWLEA